MSLLRQLFKSGLSTVLPRRKFLTRGPRLNQVALTFDDGPHPEFTPALLDQLAAYQIPATFFVIGQQAEQHPEILRRIVAEGHTLASHTWTHNEPAWVSAPAFVEELKRTESLLNEFREPPKFSLMRPPKGKLTFGKLWGTLKQKQTIVLWSADPRDYQLQTVGPLEDWCDLHQPQLGEIVLMHDNHPWASHVISRFAEWRNPQRQQPVEFVTVDDWFQQPLLKVTDEQMHEQPEVSLG